MPDNRVVSETAPVRQQEFHAALIEGLARAARKLGGRGALADALDMTPQALGKVFNGSMPCVKRLFDALSRDEHILDDVAALYRKKIVPRRPDEASVALPLAAALHKVIEAEADGVKDHQELLEMEPELRRAEKVLCGLIEQINEIRRPREVRS